MKSSTRAIIKYFLSQDLNRIPYLNIGLLSDDLSLIMQSAKQDNLFRPIKEEAREKVIEDMISCATMEPEFLTYLDTDYYDQIVLGAVKTNGLALQYASVELRGYRAFVLSAIV